MSANSELTTLTALAQALSRPADLGASLDAALATVAELLGLETGWVWLLDEAGGTPDEPRLAAARALPAALRDHPDAMRGDCHCLKTFRAGDLRGAANVNVVWCSRLARLEPNDDEDDGDRDDDPSALRCHASVPLVAGDRKLGMLNVASHDWRVLSDDELNLLTTAGAMVSLAVERSRLEAAGARAAAAEERNRLAREIHDTIAQALAGLTMQLETADALADVQGDPRLASAVTRSLALARSTLEEARRSVLDLREAPLEGRTLPAALEAVAAEMRESAQDRLDVRVVCDRDDPTMPEPLLVLTRAADAGLYRIAQQALANAGRHAFATHVTIRLTREPGRLRLRVEDDGVGFDPSSVPRDRFGLVGMSERARLLGGSLTVESSPGAGTAIDVVVPVAGGSTTQERAP
jgi:two-component system, NarL family, sensor kinase